MTSRFNNLTVNDTGLLKVPSGTTAQRPVTPNIIRWTTTNGYEVLSGSTPAGISNTNWTCPSGVTFAEVLTVGGGGGGGAPGGGGGGGGGVVYKSYVPVVAGANYTIEIGAGGAGGIYNSSTGQPGLKGGVSSFGPASPTNLITNGDFASGTTGWTASQASITTTGGALQITPNSGVNGGAYQAITTVVGKTYVLTATVTQDASRYFSRMLAGTGAGVTDANKNNLLSRIALGPGKHYGIFTATSTTTYILLEVGGGTQQATLYDNVAVYDAESMVVANGGGGGGSNFWAPTSGSSGGGQGGGALTPSFGSGITGEGFRGGTRPTLTSVIYGGGGGAGGAGISPVDAAGSQISGDGGPGLPFGISGTMTYYGGGGGGGVYEVTATRGVAGKGGVGGGGRGSYSEAASYPYPLQPPQPGADGLGGGGGGRGGGSSDGAAGGSGCVIITYQSSANAEFYKTEGQVRYNSSNTYFESSGNAKWQPVNEIIRDGLSVYWDLSNKKSYPGTGSSIADLSGSGISGTIVNSAAFLESVGKGVLNLNGSNQYVNFSSGPVNAYPLTVQMWLSHKNLFGSTTDQGNYNVALNMNIAGQRISLGAIRHTTWPTGLSLFYGGTNHWTADVSEYQTNSIETMYHVTWTIYGSNDARHQIFINGVPLRMVNNGGGHGGTAGWRLGANADPGEYYNGKVGQLAIYNRILTRNEITHNYDITRSRFQTVNSNDGYGYFHTNDLLIHVDFSNPACYPGFGYQVYDLSPGSGFHLLNGRLFGPKFGGEGLQKYFDFERDRKDFIKFGGYIPAAQSTSQLTMEAWIYIESIASTGTDDGIGAIWSSQYDTYQAGASINTDGRAAHGGVANGYHFQLGVNSSFTTDGSYGNSGVACSLGRWNHVVATRDSSGVKRIYENGYLLDTEGTWTGSINWGSNVTVWQMGAEPNGNQGNTYSSNVRRAFDGKIAIGRIYNKALTAAEVLYNYTGQKGRFGL